MTVNDTKKQWPMILLGFLPMIYVFGFMIPGFNPQVDEGDFKFENVSIDTRDQFLSIRGAITNLDDENWDSITIEVEFFDEQGVFLDEISEYLSSGIKAKSSENFKISDRTSSLYIDGYKTYTIRVTDGNTL